VPATTPSDIIIPLAIEEDIVTARQNARDVAKRLGFGMVDQSRIATAVSELARNVIRYATDSRGTVAVRSIRLRDQVGVEIVVSDDGPGIADIQQVLQPGFTSGRGLGIGLPGTRRLMDEMVVDSALGRGTTITIRKWRR
jgi:serine/threonine-protein kinase RsbT